MSSTCAFEYEAWGPNEGCAEFMTEPDTWECGQPATVVLIVTSLDPTRQDGSQTVSVHQLCAEHAQQATSELAVEPADVTYVQHPAV